MRDFYEQYQTLIWIYGGILGGLVVGFLFGRASVKSHKPLKEPAAAVEMPAVKIADDQPVEMPTVQVAIDESGPTLGDPPTPSNFEVVEVQDITAAEPSSEPVAEPKKPRKRAPRKKAK